MITINDTEIDERNCGENKFLFIHSYSSPNNAAKGDISESSVDDYSWSVNRLC